MALLDKNGRPIRRNTAPVADANRAKDHAAEVRAATRPAATIRVETVRVESAAARYPNIGKGTGVDLQVAPVLATGGTEHSGLVLSGQGVVVALAGIAHVVPIYGLPIGSRTALWGADETFAAMSPEDWSFISQCPGDHIVPALVTSRIRTLAYYEPLVGPIGLAVLQRWGDAIERVRMGVDLVDSLYGPLHFQRAKPLDGTEMDFTVEDVLRTRRRARILAWANMARTVADAATQTRKKMTEEWFENGSAGVSDGWRGPELSTVWVDEVQGF